MLAICESFCSKISSNQANIVKKSFSRKNKDISKTNIFWRNSFTSLHFIITDIRAKFARPTHITYFAHWMYLLLMLFLLLFQKNDGNIRTICSSLQLFYFLHFLLHVCKFVYYCFRFWFYWVWFMKQQNLDMKLKNL